MPFSQPSQAGFVLEQRQEGVTFGRSLASNEWQAVHYARANCECTAGNPLAVAEECTPEKFS